MISTSMGIVNMFVCECLTYVMGSLLYPSLLHNAYLSTYTYSLNTYLHVCLE
jgi:hypothetical protein